MLNKNSINKLLRRWNVELHGINYLQSLKKKANKLNEFDFFKKECHNKYPVILDIGANKGILLQRFLNYFPEANIYAFEPIHELYQHLKENFVENKKIKVFDYGISDTEGEKKFFINKGIDTSSFLAPEITGLNSDGQVTSVRSETIKTKTIDRFCIDLNIENIDILKMDIQGSELAALKGSLNMIEKRAIRIIYLETYFVRQYKDQPLFYEIANFLISKNFVLQDIYNPIYGNSRIAWCDAIFILKD